MILPKKEYPWKKKGQIILLAFLIILAIIFSARFKIAEFKGLLEKYEEISLVICLAAYVLLGMTIVPSDPLTLFLLAWKGPLIAVIMATIGNTLASIAEFGIGGSIGDLSNFESKKEKLPLHLNKLPIDSPAFLFLARMLPGFGSKFVSIVGGVYRVPLFTFLWTTLAANLLGAVVIVMGGLGIFTFILK